LKICIVGSKENQKSNRKGTKKRRDIDDNDTNDINKFISGKY